MTADFTGNISGYYPKGQETDTESAGEYANGGTNNYELSAEGRNAFHAGYQTVPVPIDWFDQYEHAKQVLEIATTCPPLVDKLRKYDPVTLGKLEAVKDHFDAAGLPVVGKTKMTKKHFESIARAISGLPTTKANKAAIALVVTPLLRKINGSFDPYRFMEAATE